MDLNVLHNINYGMFVVSSNKEKAFNGQIANTAFQVTSEPATIAISINKLNLTHEYIESSGQFSVSILSEDTPLNFIGNFGFKSGRKEDKFKNIKYNVADSGCPVVLDNTIGYIQAKVINKFDCGTHTLFLGEIIASEMVKAGKPMTYAFYHQVKRGSTPQTAPTFIKDEMMSSISTGPSPHQEISSGSGQIFRKEKNLQKYRCEVCNYIYDPAIGDPEGNIPPGVAFEKLPDNWVCPVCGADKSQFVPNGE